MIYNEGFNVENGGISDKELVETEKEKVRPSDEKRTNFL